MLKSDQPKPPFSPAAPCLKNAPFAVYSFQIHNTQPFISHVSANTLLSSSLSLPLLFSLSLSFFSSLQPSLCLEAAEELNGQSQDEVIMSLYHYILLLPFLVTENP